MKKVYIILGMKRSGHHAIVNWIAHNHSNGFLHYNNCSSGWQRGDFTPNYRVGDTDMGIPLGQTKDIKHRICNVEDLDLLKFRQYKMVDFESLKKFDEVYFALVLRDPYNWLASSIKVGGGIAPRTDSRINLWKMQAEEYLGNTCHINAPLTFVNFPKWFSSKEYRERLSYQFGMKTSHKAVDLVSNQGNGSSFDKLKFQNNASGMKILQRWHSFRGRKYFNDLIKDNQLDKYQDLIFGGKDCKMI